MIERLNRTYKASYHHTNWFDNIDDANYDLALWVAYYNFLRPHKHAGYKVLNEVEMLQGADNMPSKWQLLIFLGQQTILKYRKMVLLHRSGTVVNRTVEYRNRRLCRLRG